MINGKLETWITTNSSSKHPLAIIAISNRGRLMRKNGMIEVIEYRQAVGKPKKRVYRLLAEYFIPKTAEDIILGRDCIDHITHNPSDMYINDVRNMRWCTKAENTRFEEAIHNHKAVSEFGQKIKEHYGIQYSDNPKLYSKERRYWNKHDHKFSWEN